MTRLALCLALPLALAACSDTTAPEDPDVQDPAALDESADADVAVEADPANLDLSGTWSLASLNGSENFTNYPITATFDGDNMTLTSRCIRLVYELGRTGNIIAPEQQSQDVCPAGLSPAEQNLVEGLPQINVILAREEGARLVMSGPGGNVQLTREGAGDMPGDAPATAD